MPHELSAHEVLARYPAALGGTLTSLGNHGGFSGARLWRVDATAGSFCLKAWPTDARAPAELAWIHGLLLKAARLPWLPRVAPTCHGESFVSHQGRLWELQTWMPGVADFAKAPSAARLQSACAALAELHRIWGTGNTRTGICPGIERRWDSCRSWCDLVHSGWRPEWYALDLYAEVAQPLWLLVERSIDDVPRLLIPWLTRSLALQPCVCDLWHDHVLFTGDTVTGLIDFGSVKIDHVAVDLARLLGSLIGNDGALWEAALDAYDQLRPLSAEERALAHDLDRTGTILAATHWLRWLYHEGRVYERPAAVVERLAHLIQRLR
ncbi:MAG: hypothetical protein EXR98_01815 [Gemmataceae bacterium]|nr:hypothetical protein [Gemmataceae bacterium]